MTKATMKREQLKFYAFIVAGCIAVAVCLKVLHAFIWACYHAGIKM